MSYVICHLSFVAPHVTPIETLVTAIDPPIETHGHIVTAIDPPIETHPYTTAHESYPCTI